MMTDFKLIETMRWTGAEGCALIEAHFNRLRESAAALGFALDELAVRASLDSLAASPPADSALKVRLLLNRDGSAEISSEPLASPATSTPQPVAFCADRTDSADPMLRHKTTLREFYDSRLAQAKSRGLYDLIFSNERGEITEGAWNNVAAEINGELFTPPASCGLLPGVFRANLLARGLLSEKILTCEDLLSANSLYLCNAVRGLVKITLLDNENNSR